MRLGIFGGTFDPPHLGHLILAEEAHHQLGLDRLLWVLTPNPPHKRGQAITPLSQRLDMLRAALAGNPAFELSTVDIDRPPPHFAVDTLHLLADAYPGADLIYLMGGDSLRDLPTWRRPLEFVAACRTIGVMRRPVENIEPDGGLDAAALQFFDSQLPGLAAKVRFIEAPLLQIAASEIRRRVAAGCPYRYYVPDAVYQIIHERGLYLPNHD